MDRFVLVDNVEVACQAFSCGLKNLIISLDGNHRSRACLICDHLLEWNDKGYLTKVRLNALQNILSDTVMQSRYVTERWVLQDSVRRELKAYYSYNGNGYESWMAAMFLSPHGNFNASQQGFNCCQTCCQSLGSSTKASHVNLPKYAIANGGFIGNVPNLLTMLKDVKLSLVSMA